MPKVFLPCGWTLSWTDFEPLELVVYHQENKRVKFYGKADRDVLSRLIDCPDSILYDIEEDGEIMELRFEIGEVRKIYTLRSRCKSLLSLPLHQ